MLTLEFQKINLRVTQQSNKFCDTVKNLRGHLHLNSGRGVASFVEAQVPSYVKNEIVWRGKNLTLRIDKEGKLRGTFRVALPENFHDMQSLLNDLFEDFGAAIAQVEELSSARQPEKIQLIGGTAA